ncbi:MAG: lamin tail domain-containing protein, partial [Chthoniobacteraceae bacterium]
MSSPFPRFLVLSVAIILGVLAPGTRAEPLVSEIMFHPAGVRENPALEFIELYNPDPTPFDLTGARIDRGVTFAFPATSIPAGGRLVVAANVSAFQVRYPGVTNVVGGWTGSLSNSEETIR